MDWPLPIDELAEPWRTAWSQCWHMLLAFGLAVPIGWDRERRDQSAGLRTFPLVSVASCGLLLVGEAIGRENSEAVARVAYGVVTGMGFLGAGAILKDGRQVVGLTTAASLWNTAAIGLAVAADQYAIAVLLAILNVTILRLKKTEAPHRPGVPDARPPESDDESDPSRADRPIGAGR